MIKNLSVSEITKDKIISNSFLNAKYEDLKLNCNIYYGDFYMDSFNYFLISEKFNTFDKLFSRDQFQNNEHYYSYDFFKNFKTKMDKFKELKNIFILGSSAANNYYSNLIQFLPRIFFTNKNDLKIAIHRNSSLKFRDLIKLILKSRKINFSFVYLDDGFYKFTNAEMPQFINIDSSVKILRNLIVPSNNNIDQNKIYVTREDSVYRKIVNEADIISVLRSKGYKVINPQQYKIDEQINIFSKAKKIIAPHGSNLSNIVFCNPGTEIFEIGPTFDKDFEKPFENRYKYLSKLNNLKYTRFITDTVPVEKHSDTAIKYINEGILNSSNYYRNLIVKVNDIKNID